MTFPLKYTSGFAWHISDTTPSAYSVVEYELRAPSGKTAAHVWESVDGERFTWHTYDENGIGGENAVESRLDVAMRECDAALFRQGWHVRPKLRRSRKKVANG